MGKKLVAYVRVSSKGQIDNTSRRTQFRKIREYCQFKGHQIVGVYRDAASGKTLDRDGFQKALDQVMDGGADGIIVWSLDRFARSALRGWQTIADLEDADKHLVVVNRDLDTTGPTGKLIRNILLAVADYERSLIAERCASGREAKKSAGGYFSGQPRFGWRAEGKSVKPVPSEQRTIRVLKKFRELGVTSYRAAQYLNAHIDRHPTKRGGAWSHKSVEGILNAQVNQSNGYSSQATA